MVTHDEKELIANLIDLDYWKHSWHIDIYKADEKTVNYNLKNIIFEKIENRNKEIADLVEGLKILNSFILKEDSTIESKEDSAIESKYFDDLPF